MAHDSQNDRSPLREVTLTIDGTPVVVNGFVKDVFQQVVVGLVRSLGDEDADGRIEILISPVDEAK